LARQGGGNAGQDRPPQSLVLLRQHLDVPELRRARPAIEFAPPIAGLGNTNQCARWLIALDPVATTPISLILIRTSHISPVALPQIKYGIIALARLSTRKKPAMSVIVVNRGPLATAGS
jgi:hypothetical protein